MKLPETTADQASHYHLGGSVGPAGENSAECACGVIYDGFDTVSQATETLARHIADATHRDRVIQSIEAIAQFLRDNPDIPAPRRVDLNAYPGAGNPAEVRVGALDEFATRHPARRYGLPSAADKRNRHEYAELDLAQEAGFKATYTLSTTVRADPEPVADQPADVTGLGYSRETDDAEAGPVAAGIHGLALGHAALAA